VATGCNPNPAPSLAPSSYDPSTASYDAANHITWLQNQAPNVISYDGSGNMTFDGSSYYAYDGEGRICSTEAWPESGGVIAFGYLYDADGRRVAKGTVNPAPLGQAPSCDPASNGFTLTESYVLGQGGERLTALSWAGTTSTWENTNVYGDGKLIATYDSSPSISGGQPITALHFQLSDPLGSRRVQTNAVGQAEQECQSLPFGDGLYCYPAEGAPAEEAVEDATGSQTGIHFTGKERDAESGLDYFGARYYGSSMGRFMSPDYQDMDDDNVPEAIPNGAISNPQTLNLYSYVENNPLSKRDYDGHASWQDCNDGSGAQCWVGDYNGEHNNGLFWNAQSNQWQANDPNPPPANDPAGIVFTGLTRVMLGDTYGFRQMSVGAATAFVRGGGNPVGMALASAIPAFIPKGWIQKPSNKGTGTKYVDPNNPHNSVRLEPAKPGSSNPGQQRDYMVVTKNGQTLDANGNPVPRQSLESHIPQGTELPADTFGPVE
jgi:RHS repeat-associated protein